MYCLTIKKTSLKKKPVDQRKKKNQESNEKEHISQ